MRKVVNGFHPKNSLSEYFEVACRRILDVQVESDQSSAALPFWRSISAPTADTAIGEFYSVPLSMVVVDVVMTAENCLDSSGCREPLE